MHILMNRIPIVFAFDNNLAFPAAVCIYSLLSSAKSSTAYDIYVLFRKGKPLNLSLVDKVLKEFPGNTLKTREVDDIFDKSFEIRGITTAAYYRLLIPDMFPEYDRVIYSDVDVIFRQDLSDVYKMDIGNNLLAGVNNLAHIDCDLKNHYEGTLGLDSAGIICSGFLLMNCKAMRQEGLVRKFVKLSGKQYKFQDQDILNIACAGRISMLEPIYSLLTYIIVYSIVNGKNSFLPLWSADEINEALTGGNMHYNGQKPWKGYCLNFDLWWEYYRKSPIFDERFYFDYFNDKMSELDRLPLWKRIKILLRYFFKR